MDVNEKAPEFTLPDENGEPVTLSSFKGKPVVLFFYPRANTPGCTIEACGFRDQYGKLIRAGLTVLGISPDTSKAQKKFQEKYQLPYTLLADACRRRPPQIARADIRSSFRYTEMVPV